MSALYSPTESIVFVRDAVVAAFARTRPAGVCPPGTGVVRLLRAGRGQAMEQGETGVCIVLVVDDYDDTRKLMRQAIETRGCRVLEASNGQEAIELAQSEHPDLILMDLNMPVLDGFNATLRIREYEQTRDVPVVAVTAHDTAEFRAAAGAVGCCEYLLKPLDFERLYELMKRLLPPRAAHVVER